MHAACATPAAPLGGQRCCASPSYAASDERAAVFKQISCLGADISVLQLLEDSPRMPAHRRGTPCECLNRWLRSRLGIFSLDLATCGASIAQASQPVPQSMTCQGVTPECRRCGLATDGTPLPAGGVVLAPRQLPAHLHDGNARRPQPEQHDVHHGHRAALPCQCLGPRVWRAHVRLKAGASRSDPCPCEQCKLQLPGTLTLTSGIVLVCMQQPCGSFVGRWDCDPRPLLLGQDRRARLMHIRRTDLER